MFCLHCGANIDNASFCPICGAKVNTNFANMNGAPNSGGMPEYAGQEPTSKGISVMTIVLVVSAFVVVTAAVIVVWLLKANKDNTAVSDTDTTGVASEERKETKATSDPKDEKIAAGIDWKTMYCDYIEENNIFKQHFLSPGEYGSERLYYPIDVFVKDCDLDNIPEVYYKYSVCGDEVWPRCNRISIVAGEVKEDEICRGYIYGFDSKGGLLCSGVLSCENYSDGLIEKYPDNIQEIKEYICSDDFAKADVSQKKQMEINGWYTAVSEDPYYKEAFVGYMDGYCYFYLEDKETFVSQSVYGILEDDFSGSTIKYIELVPQSYDFMADYKFSENGFEFTRIKKFGMPLNDGNGWYQIVDELKPIRFIKNQ